LKAVKALAFHLTFHRIALCAFHRIDVFKSILTGHSIFTGFQRLTFDVAQKN
jgi:hypothetical protein